jgi:cytidyltransferase-like protein
MWAKIAISGGMDPLTIGHVEYIKRASLYGDVIVILNSDEWLMRKKGYIFMPWTERRLVLEAMKYVQLVVGVDDSDGTVCKALEMLRPQYFGKGGDRVANNTPESELCEKLGIKVIYGLGEKIQSSSSLVENVVKAYNLR